MTSHSFFSSPAPVLAHIFTPFDGRLFWSLVLARRRPWDALFWRAGMPFNSIPPHQSFPFPDGFFLLLPLHLMIDTRECSTLGSTASLVCFSWCNSLKLYSVCHSQNEWCNEYLNEGLTPVTAYARCFTHHLCRLLLALICSQRKSKCKFFKWHNFTRDISCARYFQLLHVHPFLWSTNCHFNWLSFSILFFLLFSFRVPCSQFTLWCTKCSMKHSSTNTSTSSPNWPLFCPPFDRPRRKLFSSPIVHLNLCKFFTLPRSLSFSSPLLWRMNQMLKYNSNCDWA